MSLNAHDRQALAQIEETLSAADPRFAAELSAFSRLVDGGSMPESERIRGVRLPAVYRRTRRPGASRPGTHRLLSWIVVALWLSIALALISAAIVLGGKGPKTECTEWQVGVCSKGTGHSAPPGPSGQSGHVSSLNP